MQIKNLASLIENLKNCGEKDLLHQILHIDEERALSSSLENSGIQDSALARYRLRAHFLSLVLIDEKGLFDKKKAIELLSLWEKSGRFFYTNPASDELAYNHVKNTLRWLIEDKGASGQLLKFSLPLANHYFEQLTKIALFLPKEHVLTTVDLRRAILSSCLCFLRQSVGSCFATAPAIFIHTERAGLFLSDLAEILFTSRLKRIIEGEEYSVPCSPGWGVGDLKKPLFSQEMGQKPWLSIGLMRGLLAAGISKERLYRLEGRQKNVSVDEFFNEEVLLKFGIEKSEWQNFQKRQRLFFRKPLLDSGNAKEVSLEKAERALQEAKNAFRGVTDHPFLKTWEYTLASFSEIKMDFSRWNLYASLGMNPKEPSGIGAILYEDIEEKIEKANQSIKEVHDAYVVAAEQVRATEVLFRNVSTETEARRLKSEHSSRLHHMHTLLEMRDETRARGLGLTTLAAFLLEQYHKRFPEYFQEIYDAELFDSSLGPYEDSAAGFRLVYKHGRGDPHVWSLIRNGEEYIDALADFFKMSESQIIAECEMESSAKEIPRLTDKILHHLYTQDFLDSAMLRMKKAYAPQKFPRQAQEMLAGEKKPWAYISGGTMDILLKTYFQNPLLIHQEGRWVEDASDLLVMLLEILKGLKFQTSEEFRKGVKTKLLMQSPTHAFSLLPGKSKFCEGWYHDRFSYTWVRDELIEPSKRFYEGIIFSSEEANYLYRLIGINQKTFSSIEIEEFIASISKKYYDKLDELLFLHLPFSSKTNWKSSVSKLINVSLDDFSDDLPEFLSSQALMTLAKACYLVSRNSLQLNVDLHGMILENAISAGLAAPRIVFADTNWPHYFFAFAWGASSKRLRLYAIDPAGQKAFVMSAWEPYLNGENRLAWVVYCKPEQYFYPTMPMMPTMMR